MDTHRVNLYEIEEKGRLGFEYRLAEVPLIADLRTVGYVVDLRVRAAFRELGAGGFENSLTITPGICA